MAERDLAVEMLLLGTVRHENIVALEGAGRTDCGMRFLALEYLSRGTMSAMVSKRNKSLGVAAALPSAIQLASALEHLHDRALEGYMVIHRDLKPDNIAFSQDGCLKLMDFGLAKWPSSYFTYLTLTPIPLTRRMTGETGSPRYMSPEVALNLPYNEKVDTYAFALIVWGLICSQKPFQGMNPAMFHRCVIQMHERPPLSNKWDSELKELLSACWDVDHQKRLVKKEAS
ncbi:unnamed protein product [Chrysoparadoxa australica]